MMEKIGLLWEFIFIRFILPLKNVASRLSWPDIEHFMTHAATAIYYTDTAIIGRFSLRVRVSGGQGGFFNRTKNIDNIQIVFPIWLKGL